VAPADWPEVDGALERTFELDSFPAALDFVNRLGALAEAENHHPDIAISYRTVTVRWWTHTAGGVTDRDRELAAKTSTLDASVTDTQGSDPGV
jgi:4a-hydroxytetrahydrobiopterin dehydratase